MGRGWFKTHSKLARLIIKIALVLLSYPIAVLLNVFGLMTKLSDYIRRKGNLA